MFLVYDFKSWSILKFFAKTSYNKLRHNFLQLKIAIHRGKANDYSFGGNAHVLNP